MGAQHGQGTYTSADGSTYVGAWENGSMHGYGVYTWASGTIYDGWWADGTQNGEGTMRWEGGTTYTGQWVNGTQHGQGTMTYSNGYVESGTWENGKFVAAICAGPTVLADLGITNGKNTTCYPGCEGGMGTAIVHGDVPCIRDGKLITGASAGCAVPFGLALIAALKGDDAAQAVQQQIVIR